MSERGFSVPPNHKMHFVERDHIARDIARTYAIQREIIRSILPRSRIRHIGSTAIPKSITKGDIDLLVSVDPSFMTAADARLSQSFKRNKGSSRSSTFSSFAGHHGSFPVGVQLVARGSDDESEFMAVQNWLAQPAVVRKYNCLKQRFEGSSASAYRRAKSDFMRTILEKARQGEGGR